MSLDTLRNLHAQTVEALMMELAQITQSLSRQEQAVRMLEAGLHSDVTIYRQQTGEGLFIESILEWHARMDAQQAVLSEARREIASLTAAWHDTQARLVAASQERTILDRFVERREQARQTEVSRREQLALDEAGQRRHASLDKRL